MTTIMESSLERRLLETVGEQVAAEPVGGWDPRSLQLCLNVLREIRASATDTRQAVEEELAGGVEARSFTRHYGPFLAAADQHVALVRELLDRLSPPADPASEGLLAELRLLEREHTAFRDLLGEALSRASEPPRPVDEGRVRAAEAAHARGETKPITQR